MNINLENNKNLNINLYEIRLDSNIIDNNNLLDAFLLDCQCALFLVDITNNDNFKYINDLYINIDKYKYSNLKIILVQNKIDIEPEKQNEELNKFINEHPDIDHIKISIKNNINLNDLLLKIYNIFNSQEKTFIPLNQVSKCKYSSKININLENSCSLILLGSQNVGKTNFLTRYDSNYFNPIITTTVGINTGIKVLKINNKNIYKLSLYDTAGQERFRAIPEKYYRNSDGILLLFELNNRESFNEISNWITQIEEHNEVEKEKEKDQNIIIYLLGNKIDLIINGNDVISNEEKENLVKKFNVKYYEISCKWNLNIEEVMARIILDCTKLNKIRAKTFVLSRSGRANSSQNSGRGGCCNGNKNNKKKE